MHVHATKRHGESIGAALRNGWDPVGVEQVSEEVVRARAGAASPFEVEHAYDAVLCVSDVGLCRCAAWELEGCVSLWAP